MSELASGLESKNWVPSWFTVSVKTGSLVLHLDYPSCFDAEVFAEDLGISISTPEEKRREETECDEDKEKSDAVFDETTGSCISLVILTLQ